MFLVRKMTRQEIPTDMRKTNGHLKPNFVLGNWELASEVKLYEQTESGAVETV